MKLAPLFPKWAVLALALVGITLPIRAKGLQSGDYVAIIGDSITEQKQYSVYIEDYLLMCQPAPNLQATQFGWSGDKASGFVNRMENDALIFKPTVATTCYGMNDGGYNVSTPEILAQYKRAMTEIVKKFKANGVRFIVVGSPGVVDSFTYKRPVGPDIYNKTLGELRDLCKQIATEQDTAFADVHGVMLAAMEKAKAKYGKEYPFAGGDGVHPGANGQFVMAYTFLKGLGCDGNIGTITVDMKGNKATATDGHKILSADKGVVEIESSRYPFCFTSYGQASALEMAEFIPFDEELNRYLLVVKDAPAANLKVTWGAESKVFPAAALQKGINLAVEFRSNPFGDAFTNVEKVIRAQQAYETPAVKSMLHFMTEWRKILPEREETYKEMEQAVLKKDAELRQASRAAVQPVKHTIKIEPAA